MERMAREDVERMAREDVENEVIHYRAEIIQSNFDEAFDLLLNGHKGYENYTIKELEEEYFKFYKKRVYVSYTECIALFLIDNIPERKRSFFSHGIIHRVFDSYEDLKKDIPCIVYKTEDFLELCNNNKFDFHKYYAVTVYLKTDPPFDDNLRSLIK